MEQLLPIVFNTLSNHVFNSLNEDSQFFKDICALTLRVDDLIKIDQNILTILCKMEQFFPIGFFDSMEHIPVHLAFETLLSGHVKYMCIYTFEIFMGDSKQLVKNKTKV